MGGFARGELLDTVASMCYAGAGAYAIPSMKGGSQQPGRPGVRAKRSAHPGPNWLVAAPFIGGRPQTRRHLIVAHVVSRCAATSRVRVSGASASRVARCALPRLQRVRTNHHVRDPEFFILERLAFFQCSFLKCAVVNVFCLS